MTPQREIAIDVAEGVLGASLNMPPSPRALIIFAHGSGSSRFSSRNRFVAGQLERAGFGTLLTDLLTANEDRIDRVSAEFRFDVALLAQRLVAATQWARGRFAETPLSIGYFGASTGAAAALIATAGSSEGIGAVVSRGGRPDLAGKALPRVGAATLLIVGGEDHEVIRLNRQAQAAMRCKNDLAIVAGATHLFEEPGALERVAALATTWFRDNLKSEPL